MKRGSSWSVEFPTTLGGRRTLQPDEPQFLRAGTSVGANYEEGRGGESRADFIHKLGIAWKEIRESRFWLRVIHRAELISPPRVEPLLQEAEELCAILSKSLETAKRNAREK